MEKNKLQEIEPIIENDQSQDDVLDNVLDV